MMATMSIPMDVVTDILLRLPAKSVLRFKSVCKLWYDLIKGHDFVRLHLERSLVTQSNLHFVIRNPVLHLADFDTFDNPIELNYPFKRPDHGGASVVGSCHGLLCLWNYDYDLSLFLYNPTTQTHLILPFLPIRWPFSYAKAHFNFGFGYDSFSKSYKCVRILQMFYKETDSFVCEVMVYSLRTHSWRRAQDIPYYFYCHRGESAFFNETIHWVGEHGYRERVFHPILAFNLKDETFSTIALPDLDTEEHIYDMIVGVLDECLCLTVNYIYYSDVWVMKEYGVAGSWSRLFSVGRRAGYEYWEGIVSYSISRKELFVRFFPQVVSLDVETLEVMDVKVSDFHLCSFALVCVENLLMLNDVYDGLVGEQKQGEKKRRSRKRRRKNRRATSNHNN